MIRYTLPLAPGIGLAVSAENSPGTDGNDVSDLGGSKNITKFQSIPDFVANLQASGPWGSASARGITMNFRSAPLAGGALDPNGSSYSKQGYGGAVSTALKVGGDTLILQAVGGAGIGRYIFNVGLSPHEGAVFDTGTELALWDAFAYHAGFTHVWSPAFRSNVVWSQTFIKDNGNAVAGDNRRMDQAFGNSFWTFAKSAEVGLEYGWGRRETFDGSLAHQNRITGTVHYNFL